MACLWPKFGQANVAEHVVRLLPAAEGDLAGKESECGYAQALDRLLPTHPRLRRAVIVPSASALEGIVLSSLVREAQLGSTVLIDLADGFASRSATARTRKNLGYHLGIEIGDPVAYPTRDYITYRWPVPVLVRHFTRISYVEPGQHVPVAYLGTHSIAVRKEIGRGSVVIIGSTLGSLLLAEDEHAHQIVAHLLTTTAVS
jgi:hypothetical protein